MNLGNDGVRLRVNGRSFKPPATTNPIGYEVRAGKSPTKLAESARVRLCS